MLSQTPDPWICGPLLASVDDDECDLRGGAGSASVRFGRCLVEGERTLEDDAVLIGPEIPQVDLADEAERPV